MHLFVDYWKGKYPINSYYILIFQNFDEIAHVPSGQEGYFGGSVSLADYCPYIQEFTWRSKNVVVRGSHCRYIENNPRKLNYEPLI